MSVELEGYRLSPRQRWLWLLSERGTYTVQATLALAGPWEAARLRRALEGVVRRHDALRTRFVRPEGVRVPLQVIGEEAPAWGEHDLSADAPEVREERLAALEAAERRAIGCNAEAPVRAALVHLAPGRGVLLLTVSALCADGRSLRNLVEELMSAYGGEVPEEAPVQYLQYSEWEHSVREEAQGPRGRDRWLSEGLPEPFGPALARQSAVVAAPFRPAVRAVTVAAAKAQALGRLAERLGATFEELLRGAWQVLLWRVTGASPVTLDVTLPGRKHESLLDAIGPFARPVPVALEIEEGDDLASVLERQRAAAARAEEWLEHYAADDFLRPDDPPGRFPIGFEWEEWSSRALAGGLEISLTRREGALDRTRLSLFAVSNDGRLSLEVRHDAACLSADEAARWAGRLELLLDRFLEAPGAPLGELDVLTDAERDHLLVELNRPRSGGPPEATLHRVFSAQAELTPEAVAVERDGRTLRYAELERRSDRLARVLRRRGVGPEVVVGLFLTRSPDLVVALLGVLKAGGAYLPLEPEDPAERLGLILKETGASVVLTEPALAPLLPDGTEVLSLDEDGFGAGPGEGDGPALQDCATPENLAYVLYTSGSTGRPKGVMIPHRGVVNYLAWCGEAYAVAEGRGAPVHSPLGFDLTVTSLWSPLLSGGKVVLLSEREGIEGLARALVPGADFSLVKLTPAHLEALGPAAATAARATRALVVGGEALRGEALAPWRASHPGLRVFNEYGPTETVVGCVAYEVPAGSAEGVEVPIGRPIAGTRVYLLNRSLRPVHEGAVGELYVGGDGVTRGYVGDPAATAASLVPDPFCPEPGARLYRTGDLARHLPDGNLIFLGREDGQVKIRGYRVELGEVESVLARHPELGGAVVVAREDAPGDRRLVAYVAGRADGSPPNTDELRRFLLQTLPEPMVPGAFVPLAAFPLTPNGKVDRRALPAPSEERPDLDQPYVEPRTAVERSLAEIWSEVLGVERVGVHDNYFSLGGDSMRSVRVVALAHERGLELTLQDLFRFRTVAKLAELLDSPDRAPVGAAPALDEDEEMARLLDEIEALSDEDARERIDERLGAVGGDDRP